MLTKIEGEIVNRFVGVTKEAFSAAKIAQTATAPLTTSTEQLQSSFDEQAGSGELSPRGDDSGKDDQEISLRSAFRHAADDYLNGRDDALEELPIHRGLLQEYLERKEQSRDRSVMYDKYGRSVCRFQRS